MASELPSGEGGDACFKMVLLGDGYVGKSSLAQRFVHGKFPEVIQTTVGASFFVKTIEFGDGRVVRLEMWDTAGQERFKAVGPMFYRGAHAAIVVFDVTKAESFERAKYWVEELHKHAKDDVVIGLAANKIDMVDDRVVSAEDGASFADAEGLQYYETSAKDGTNVDQLFESVSEMIPVATEVDLSRRDTVYVDGETETRQGGGCPC